MSVRSLPSCIQVQFDEFNSSVSCKLTDDRQSRYQNPSRDQDSVLVATIEQPGHVVEVSSKLLDHAKKLINLEVLGRWLACWTALGVELAIKVLEEAWSDSNSPPIGGHYRDGDSVASMRACIRVRILARKSGGTSSRSRTILAWKISSCSAGERFSRSSAVQIFLAMSLSYLPGRSVWRLRELPRAWYLKMIPPFLALVAEASSVH